MDPRHARYPYFEAARRAVRAADVSPPTLVSSDAPAVERGLDRVERALVEGTVAAEEPGRWSPRDELLSYPVARILVSLLDVPAAVEKYAEAEAATAHERFAADFEAGASDLRSVEDRTVDLDEFLREFGLDDDVTDAGDGDRRSERFRVAVGAYLRLADPTWGNRWRLVNRELADGAVLVELAELHRLLREAVRRRVAEGLPFEVRDSPGGEDLATALEAEVSDLRDLLEERGPTRNVDVVVPGLFPPCMRALLTRAREGDGEDLPAHSRFALMSFLVGLGMDRTEVAALTDIGDERIEYAVTVLEDGDGTQYPPPSCSTMAAYGDCVNKDDRCETISHPTAYYADAVADAPSVTDWRETN